MSPVIQRKRPPAPPGPPDPTAQHWGMLMFESFSAGVLAIFAGMVAVLVVVSLYVIFVWPLTFWDLADSGLERFGPWVNPVLAGVFLVGSGVGYFLFSGAAFKRRAQARTAVPMRTRR